METKKMKKTRILIVAAIVMFTTSNPLFAWKVVTDPYCLKAVTTNLATQKAIEDGHNQRLDSISSRKRKVELYTVSMATIKELYKATMQNVSSFGTESKYYVEIGRCAFDILRDVPELVKTVNKAKFSNKLLCLNELGNIVTETQQLVGDFVNIVNNAQIENPLKEQSNTEKKSDGYNFLDRYERLTVANTIYSHLTKLRYKVEGMMAMAQYATLNDLCFAIDPEGWANVVTMKNQVSTLIWQWNGLQS